MFFQEDKGEGEALYYYVPQRKTLQARDNQENNLSWTQIP